MRLQATVIFSLCLGVWHSPGAAASPFIAGVDISSLPEIEQAGVTYRDAGISKDALSVFASRGVNGVRLRLWHTPAGGYCDLSHTLAMAKRVRAQGMRLLLDIHYSDSWADPAKQTKPAAWANLSFDALEVAVHDYTRDVVAALVSLGTPPDAVQIGNEITGGMLWPSGRIFGSNDSNWPRLARLLKAGVQGVKDGMGAGGHATIVLHIDRGGDNATARGFYDACMRNSVPFDEIGLSYYPWWHGRLSALKANLADLAARYGKPVSVVETGYPWTLGWNDSINNIVGQASQLEPGYPATPEGQARFLAAVTRIVLSVPHGRGAGMWYWEPGEISSPDRGSVWENIALFDFQGNAQPALREYQVWPVVRYLLGAGGLTDVGPDAGQSTLAEAVGALRRIHGL